MKRYILRMAAVAGVLVAAAAPGRAAESLDRTVLPVADPAFKGKIGETFKDSTPDFPQPIAAPEGAPNVLIILLDDTGFGHAGAFGGAVETPTMDRLAEEGLRYTRFHTTSLCSPTRAALLTGRNHHSVATGVVTEMGTGYPGYSGIVPGSAAALPEILRLNGYATAAFGKWHNTPDTEISPAGPFDRWPTGRTWGFDYFYGFMNGETHQYYPVLYRNTTPVVQPKSPAEGYYLTTDLADEAISWLNRVNAANPKKPWLLYFATGAIHAPHQVPAAYREKYKGRFDAGWDKYREETFARQKAMGVIPSDAKLTQRPSEIPAWADQTEEAKKIYRRLMENYSGFLDQADEQVGRLITRLETSGEMDNTLVIYIVGDNGASVEGGLEGTISEVASVNGIQLGLPGLIAKYDEIGGPRTDAHVPVGWAWAANTPFQWGKQVASHFGGTRNGLIVTWPKGFAARGDIRTQFHHVIDIAPTVLEAAGLPQPRVVNGVVQKPMEGVSMIYSFDDAKAASRRTVQYFEMLGNRAIYKDGWMAGARHGRLPWETGASTGDFAADKWELYDVEHDFSQADDLAAKNPEKLKELQQAFLAEAAKYDVLPLDDRLGPRFDMTLRPNPLSGITSFNYGPGVTGIGEGAFLNTHGVPFTITATVEVGGDNDRDGVIAAIGGIISGWTLYVKDGRPVFAYNYFDVEHTKVQSSDKLKPGKAVIRAEITPVEPGPGKAARVRLAVNGAQVAEGLVPHTVPFRYGVEPFDVGMDTVSAVTEDYKTPFPFQGTIGNVAIDVGQP